MISEIRQSAVCNATRNHTVEDRNLHFREDILDFVNTSGSKSALDRSVT